MADVFLSYSSHDIDFVTPMIEGFGSFGLSVWWDHKLYAGNQYRSAIEKEIAAAGVVIVVWSRNSVESSWVISEAATARDLKKLIPTRIDDCAAPIDFRTLHILDLTSWPIENQKNFEALRQTIKASIESRVGSSPVSSEPAKKADSTDSGNAQLLTAAEPAENQPRLLFDGDDWSPSRRGWRSSFLKYLYVELSGLMLPDGKWRPTENVVEVDRKSQSLKWLVQAPPPARIVVAINPQTLRPYTARSSLIGFSAAVVGVLLVALSVFYFDSRVQDFVIESMRLRVRLPYRVAIIGPTSGQYKSFGEGHLRGVISGFFHAIKSECGREAGQVRQLFTFTPVDEAPYLAHPEQVAEMFSRLLKSNDLVFGPVFSQSAVNALMGHEVNKPVVLSMAATTKVREHPQFGQTIFQLADNVDTYAAQLLRYFWEYSDPRPTKLLVLYQDDEYGKSGRDAVVGQSAQYGFDVRSRFIRNDLDAGEQYTEVQMKAAQEIAAAARAADEKTVIVIVALGRSLRLLVEQINPTQVRAKIATITSLELETLDAGTFNGIYVVYSYFPRTYSVGTLSFFENTKQATVLAQDLLGEAGDQNWPNIGTIEAETHDAAYYWASTHLIRHLGIVCSHEGVREFATNFSIIGDGPSQYMNTALLLFQVRNGSMVPVQLSDK